MPAEPHTVAIVDDEEDITTSLSVALEDHGYRVVATNDPRAAIDVLERARPAVIVLDLLMPRMTGASLYARIRLHPTLRGTPVVILSGIPAGADLRALADEDVSGVQFVEKPADIASVVAAIRAACAAREEAVT